MTDPSQPEVPKVLKAAVIIMGVLLIAGFAALVVTIAVKANRLVARSGDVPLPAGQTIRAAPFTTHIEIPGGMEVQDMAADDEVILIRLSGQEKNQIIMIDARTGEKRGVITLGK